MRSAPPIRCDRRAGIFDQLARKSARATGHPAALSMAGGLILIWALSGPLFQFSDTWQLVINTTTTIVTFLMVFLIQSSQNRDNEAIQLKLDELIRATKGAQNALLSIEDLSEDELDGIKARFEKLAVRARQQSREPSVATGKPKTISLELDQQETAATPRVNGKTQKDRTS